VEDQPDNFKSSFKAVPVIIIFKNGKPVKRVEADLSMKIKARLEDIQELVDRYQ
jgi:thioredoxin-like negative regulator of GroEL